MRTLCHRLASLFCLFLLAGSAWATQITIQDPSNAVAPFTVNPITTPVFTVTFSNSCQSALSPGQAGYTDAGCFSFTNRTGEDWSGLTLTTTFASPDGRYTCASPDVFQSCTYDATTGLFTLSYTQGDVSSNPSPHSYYTISEDDIDPSLLTFQATVTFASTPEPSGLLLMGTGLVCAGLLLRQRRHAQA